ncbi:MAG: hypothetical protein J7K87_03040 [Candidatus Aenigmarchaeota archaeon]|nr:hypothetical protein [Candidatus Aenigmarchaeota archaeon]
MKKILELIIVVCIVLLSIEYVKAGYNNSGSSANICEIALKIDAAADASSFSLYQTAKIMVYTMKACGSPIDADVSGYIKRPTGIIDNLTFTHIDTGIYEAEYMFNSTGDYELYAQAINATWWTSEEYGGKVWVREYISVPFLSMYLSLPYGTRYQVGDTVRIWAHVEDSNGLPINDASVNITVFYPNLTTAYVSEQPMTLFANGDYYYTFTAPGVEGQYFARVEARENFSYQSKSKTFEVGGWASQIGEMNKTLEETVVPYLQEINKTVHSIDDLLNDLNITINNINTVAEEINKTIGRYTVTYYNDSVVKSYIPGSDLLQVIWREEIGDGESWIEYRAVANNTYNFTGSLNLTNMEVVGYSCYNCSGSDTLSITTTRLKYSFLTNYEKGFDLRVKLKKKVGTATFDGTINGTRNENITYLGRSAVTSLPFTFEVMETALSSTVMNSLEENHKDLTNEVEQIISDLSAIGSNAVVSSGGGSGYIYQGINNTKEILEGVRNMLATTKTPTAESISDIMDRLNDAKQELLNVIERLHKERKNEATSLAQLFSSLESASTVTMLLGLLFVILVIGVFLYILVKSREEEFDFSSLLFWRMFKKGRDSISNKLMAYSILSGRKDIANKLFKLSIAKDILEEGKMEEDVKEEVKGEIKKSIIERLKERYRKR